MPEKKPNNNSHKSESKGPDNKKSNISLFIWIVVFIVISIFIIMKFRENKDLKKWEQSKFAKVLKSGRIKTAVLTPEKDDIINVKGKYEIDSSGQQSITEKGNTGHYQTRILKTEKFSELLREHPDIEVSVVNSSSWVKDLLITIIPIFLIVGLLYFLFSRQIKNAGKGAMQFGKSKARIIFPGNINVKFDDIAGADEAKEETVEIIDFLKDPLKFKLIGGQLPKGALLTGPPGTGKTMLAKAVACEAEVPFFTISGSDFVEMFVGVGASRVRDMFEQARKNAPCLIFIDEIDAVGRSRFSGMGGGHDEREQTLNALLVEMDGLETQSGTIILAATNRPDVLDQALLRPGRFDRRIVLDLPDIQGRRKILDVHVKNIKTDNNINLDIIARGTSGFSGADIANLVNEAALLAARDEREVAIMADFNEARDKVMWGRERRSRRITEKEKRLTAHHEAGHTIVALNLKHATPVHKVTIIPRGQAYLGATMCIPEEDTYTQNKNELFDQMCVLMGGRVAEELTDLDINSGAASDIEQATKIARRMVCTFGMTDTMGAVHYSEHSDNPYQRREFSHEDPYSEKTKREIDLEIRKIISKAKNNTKKILSKNLSNIEKLAKTLLEKETIEVDEVKEIIGLSKIEKDKQDENSIDPLKKAVSEKSEDSENEDSEASEISKS